MSTETSVIVIGSGAFGTALACVLAIEGKSTVTLLSRSLDLTRKLEKTRLHDEALPGIALPEALQFSADPRILETADIVLFAMPSQAQREAALVYGPRLKPDASVVICAKGIDKQSGLLLSDVVGRSLQGQKVAVLSGPGFAADIAKGLPTAMVVAAETAETAEMLAATLSTRTFRLYASSDRIGVQLGGAVKNVLAIACGIVEGAGLGESARAALIARGLAEMTRFVVAEGGMAETVPGLSGLGDLVLTATSHQSRNLTFGIALGRGMSDHSGKLVEGAMAASVAARMATERQIDMPITQAVAAIIDGKLDVQAALVGLMSRPIKQEQEIF